MIGKNSHPEQLMDAIELVLDWAEEHPQFDTEFVESLQEQLEDNGFLTDKQIDALANIIQQWNIE